MQRESRADQAILDLISGGIEKYGLGRKDASQIDESAIDELFELALDVLGGHKETMRMLPKEKKLVLILQITVFSIKM